MQNLKIKVNSEAESKEAQELFFELGASWCYGKHLNENIPHDRSIILHNFGTQLFWAHVYEHKNFDDAKETTLAELRDMVKPMKEYLNTSTYEYKLAHTKPKGEWVCIPGGSIEARLTPSGSINFINSDSDYMNRVTGGEWVSTHRFKHDDVGHKIIWQRPTQPEALPFIDDNPQSLNEQYAEIEQVRQAIKVKSGGDSDHMADAMAYGFMGIKQDNVNHPSHYTQGKVECIDAIESATVGKTGIDAVCVANIIKYLWRYEEKNGVEDIKKAEWYLQKLIENNA